jgi:hypothetical protein
MRGWNTAGLLIVASVLSACIAQPGIDVPPAKQLLAFPPVGTVAETGAGGIVSAKGNFFAYNGLELHNQIEATVGVGAASSRVTIQPQFLFPQSEDEEWVYYAANVRLHKRGRMVIDESRQDSTSLWKVGGLQVNKANPDEVRVWVPLHVRKNDYDLPARNFRTSKPRQTPVLTKATIEHPLEESWAKELIFDGSGNGGEIHFTYQEHVGDSTEPMNRQEYQFEPTEGVVLNIEGARFEILEVSDGKLQYKVIRNFPDKKNIRDFPATSEEPS